MLRVKKTPMISHNNTQLMSQVGWQCNCAQRIINLTWH